MATISAQTRFVVYHRRLRSDDPRRAKEAGVFDALFVVYAFTKEAAEKVIRDRMGSAFNRVEVVPVGEPDKSGVEIEFYYEPPRKAGQRGRAK